MESQIILAKGISIDKSYKNVLDYSVNNMLELLRSTNHFVAEYSDYNFIRGGQISVQIPYDTVLQSNYIAFQNKEYTNKWFFAWIDEVEFVNPNTTRIIYTEDVWTTWKENWTANQVFTVREHVNDDTIGANTIPENLAVEEYVQEEGTYTLPSLNNCYVAISTTFIPTDYDSKSGHDYSGVTVINRQIVGHKVALFPLSDSADLTIIQQFIETIDYCGKISSVKDMYIVPIFNRDAMLTPKTFEYKNNVPSLYYEYKIDFDASNYDVIQPKHLSFSDYSPRNGKCFVYPYNYLFVSNNIGSNNIIKYENFNGENTSFKLEFASCIGGSGRLVPTNYKGVPYNIDESIPLGKYPVCSWTSDSYTNWLTQSASNFLSRGIGALSTIGGAAASNGNFTGAFFSTANTAASVIGDFYQAKLMPMNEIGPNTGDVNWANGNNKFSFHQMRAKTEYLRIIDDYFTRFGYKINRVKVPNLTGRSRFNYIEINQGEDIVNGNVPVKYLEEINNICSSGVTIWHNHDYIGDYLSANPII